MAVVVVLSVQSNGSRNNHPVVVAGSTIFGTVHLLIQSDEPVSNASSLELRLSGKEFTQHTRMDESYGSIQTGPVQIRDSSIFLQKDVILATFKHPLTRGQYEYPFQAELPYKLFPTLCLPGLGEIKYLLEAHLVSHAGRQGAPWGVNGWASTPLTVLSNRRAGEEPKKASLLRPKSMPTKTETIRSVCCKPGGVMALAGEVDRGLYAPGDTIQVSWKAVNHSSCSIRKVSISLHQNITFTAKDDRKTEFKEVGKQTIRANTYPELSPQKKGAADPEALLASQSFHQVPLVIPRDDTMLPAFNGKLIRVNHVIKVELQTATMVTSPDIVCGIQLQPAVHDLPPSTPSTTLHTIMTVRAGVLVKELQNVAPVTTAETAVITFDEDDFQQGTGKKDSKSN